MGLMTELVSPNDFAGSVYPADRIARNAEDLGGLFRANALPLRDFHLIPQCLRVVF